MGSRIIPKRWSFIGSHWLLALPGENLAGWLKFVCKALSGSSLPMDPWFEVQNPQKQGSISSTSEEAWLERPMTKLLSFAWVCILWIHFIEPLSLYWLVGQERFPSADHSMWGKPIIARQSGSFRIFYLVPVGLLKSRIALSYRFSLFGLEPSQASDWAHT